MSISRQLLIAFSLIAPQLVQAIDDNTQDCNPNADPKAVVQSGNARFTVLTPGVIRMEYSPDGHFDDRASYVVVNRRLPVPQFQTGESATVCNFPISWSPEKMKKSLGIRTERIALAYADDGKPFNKDNLILRTPKPGDGWNDAWELSPPFVSKNNLGGTVRTLDGVNGSIPLPDGILSRNGWYCLDDSNSLVFEGATDPWIAPRNKPGYIDWYFLSYGHDYKQALKDYISIAGRIPMPPRFAFGTWWSRYWDYTDAELRQLVKEFKEHDVPLDVLVIDMGWHLDGWTGYTWNPKCFPDPEGFLKWVHEQGLKATLNLHPAEGVGKQEKAFPQVCAAMGLDPAVTDRVPFDCTSREYMDAYFKCLHHPLEEMGIDFWWMDWQQGTNTNITGLDPLPWLNYLHWHDMEKRAAQTGKRPLLFSRWGGLGNHRYQIGFSGDTFSTWQSLAFQPYFTATAGNVGYAYWSHDIGGHMPGKVDPELYTRWIQWGALSPILRTHTTKNPEAERRIWAYPPEYFDAMKKAFELRYELIPYIYTAARQCYDTGLPICRPLYYEWPDLDEAYKHPGEYMFGDQLLAAPVTEPSDPISKCAMVEVWLPPGKWTNWFTGRTYEGPKTIPLVVPLDEIPLFVRDGGIVVTRPTAKWQGNKSVDEIMVNFFPGGSGNTVLYEDDGRSVEYEADVYSATAISHNVANGHRRIQIDPDGKTLSGQMNRRYEIRLFDETPGGSEIAVNDKRIPLRLGRWREDAAAEAFDPRVMGRRICTSEFDTRHKVVIEEKGESPWGDKFTLPNGARGLVRMLFSMREPLGLIPQNDSRTAWSDISQVVAFNWLGLKILKGHISSGPSALIENWANFLRAVNKSALPLEQKNRMLARLFGIYYKFNITKMSLESLDVELCLSSTLPFQLKHISGKADMHLESIKSMDKGLEFKELPLDIPLKLKRRIDLPKSLQPLLVTARIDLSMDDINLEIPIEKQILPSINAWYTLGPFDNPFVEGLKRQFPPDTKVDLAAEYEGKGGKKIAWKKFERQIKPGDDLTGEFFVDFDDVYGQRVYECVVYGFTYLDAPEDMDAVLALGTDDGCAVTLNDKEVHRVDLGRGYLSKQDRVPVKLKKGQNKLLLKVFQGGGDGGLCVHIEDKDGKPLTSVKPHL